MAATLNGAAFKVNDFTATDTIPLVIASGANYLHVMIVVQSEPSAVVWSVGSQSLSLVTTDTTASSFEARHYYLNNPTAGSGNIELSGLPGFYGCLVLAVNDADISGSSIRVSGASYAAGVLSPDNVTPSGNLAGDLLGYLWGEGFGFTTATSGHAAASGTTQVGSTTSRTVGLYREAPSDSSSLGLTYTGDPTALPLIRAWVAIKGAAGASSTAQLSGKLQRSILLNGLVR